jgi:hypothetical protein
MFVAAVALSGFFNVAPAPTVRKTPVAPPDFVLAGRPKAVKMPEISQKTRQCGKLPGTARAATADYLHNTLHTEPRAARR